MKKLAIISAIVLGLGAASCDSYMDINQDPNSPAESNMTPSIMMPAAEMNLCATYGNLMRIPAGYYTQHFAHAFGTSNYVDYSQFTMSATRSSTAYSQMMRGALKNLETIRTLASESEEWGTYLAATTLRAFGFQALVDCYGEIPFTETFDTSIPSPKYDQGADIYAALIAELDEALSKASATDVVATNFLFPGQRAAAWIQFANAVKLKILSRESGVASVDSQIGAIIAEGNLPGDVAYANCWANESGQMNPYYSEEFATSFGSTQINVVANVAIIGTMLQKDSEGSIIYEDPRLAAFFEPNGSGNYTGGISGTNFSTSDSYKSTYWCRPVATYDMPVYLITESEIEFFISEYYARQGNHDQAAAHYAAAIEASFATAGVAGAEENIAFFPYDSSNYKKSIGIAKWVALTGTNDFESYCELRRLRYPAFGSVKGIDMYNLQTDASYKPELYQPGTLYTPIQVDGNIGDNKLLERYPYPSSSSASNANAPKFTNADFTKPVFWAN
ncbi:MAG: SusD/RagB family nutrient-binding outer membrane lipoprotein [Prevotella sp.]|nr:SusD/RagB family nutrient-binding outer membrane lipoprotein [Prevotella sp.]